MFHAASVRYEIDSRFRCHFPSLQPPSARQRGGTGNAPKIAVAVLSILVTNLALPFFRSSVNTSPDDRAGGAGAGATSLKT